MNKSLKGIFSAISPARRSFINERLLAKAANDTELLAVLAKKSQIRPQFGSDSGLTADTLAMPNPRKLFNKIAAVYDHTGQAEPRPTEQNGAKR